MAHQTTRSQSHSSLVFRSVSVHIYSYATHLFSSRTPYSSAKIVSAFSRSARTDTAVAAEILVSPLLPRAPAASTAPTKPEPSACVDSPDTSCDGFDDLLATCISTLGVPGGRRARESLRCVLQAWGEKKIREKTEVSVSIVRLPVVFGMSTVRASITAVTPLKLEKETCREVCRYDNYSIGLKKHASWVAGVLSGCVRTGTLRSCTTHAQHGNTYRCSLLLA